MEEKKWYASRGVWGGLVTVVAGAAGAIWGFEFSAENQEATVSAIIGIVTAVSGAFAVYGRVKASAKLTK